MTLIIGDGDGGCVGDGGCIDGRDRGGGCDDDGDGGCVGDGSGGSDGDGGCGCVGGRDRGGDSSCVGDGCDGGAPVIQEELLVNVSNRPATTYCMSPIPNRRQ